MTLDHTPPKGCVKPTQVQLRHVVDILSGDPSMNKGPVSQNGVKYRTLCKRCNNGILGARYDPKLNEFANDLSGLLKTTLTLPSLISITGKPQAILKSVIGHLAAQGVDRYEKGKITDPIRDYIIDESLPLPAIASAYYWVYPYRPQVIIRDAAYSDINSKSTSIFWLLKFFPVAFLIVWGETPKFCRSLYSFERWRSAGSDVSADIPIRLSPSISQNWPEAPTDSSVVAFGQEAIYAINSMRQNRLSRRSLRK